MLLQIIVARYNESIDWTAGFTNCIIYNKGESECNTAHKVIILPNVGREGHTFLHHIITNYDTLEEYTMFLQGFPFDHCPFLEKILMSDEWKRPFHMMTNDVRYATIVYDETCAKLPSHYNMVPTFNYIFNRNKNDHPFYFGPGAQMCVSRETIRTRPKEFYKKIYDLLSHNANPLEGYMLERFWPMIFLGEGLESRSH